MANSIIRADSAPRKCSIDGCGKPQKTGSLCSMHAERKRIHGSPFLGAKKLRGVCSIEGCGKPHYANGLCTAHNHRNTRHGSPEGGGYQRGIVRPWLDSVAIRYACDDCLVFPFKRDAYGYGRINVGEKRIIGAHVYVLTAVKGEKPSLQHEACHSCGNGHRGCVNPNHLYWGTRRENVQDALTHGTFKNPPRFYGEDHGGCKYSDAEIARVFSLLCGGAKQMDVARITGMSQAHVSRIKKRQVRTRTA